MVTRYARRPGLGSHLMSDGEFHWLRRLLGCGSTILGGRLRGGRVGGRASQADGDGGKDDDGEDAGANKCGRVLGQHRLGVNADFG